MKKLRVILPIALAMLVISGCAAGSGGTSVETPATAPAGETAAETPTGDAETPAGNAESAATEPADGGDGVNPDTGDPPPTAPPAEKTETDAAAQEDGASGLPNVYMTADISPEGLMAVYEALGWEPQGNVAVKITTGEPPASNYLSPDLIGGLVKSVGGAFVECNTAYGGSRSETAMHRQVAEDHGYTAIAAVDIQDAYGSLSIPVTGGERLTENFVGASFDDYDSYLVLSHFKGHQMAGYGGALKNISIGMASSEGKAWIHSGGVSKTNMWGGDQDAFLESMAEAGKAVSDALGGGERIVYINVMNRLSVDCDCNGNPAEPDMHDIGVLASIDPVALDQACLDLVYGAADGQSLTARIDSRNGLHTPEHAEKIGLGSREYTLVRMDA
jgi:uncharacterized Fe-S center protein